MEFENSCMNDDRLSRSQMKSNDDDFCFAIAMLLEILTWDLIGELGLNLGLNSKIPFGYRFLSQDVFEFYTRAY